MAKALELHEAGVRLSTIGEELGVSKAHVSRLVKQAREQGAGSSMSEIDKSLMSAIKWTERHRDVLEWAVDQALAIKASGARVPMNALHEAAMERAPEMRCSRGAFEMAVRRRMGVSDE
jgi:predicted transcriptional regulator